MNKHGLEDRKQATPKLEIAQAKLQFDMDEKRPKDLLKAIFSTDVAAAVVSFLPNKQIR